MRRTLSLLALALCLSCSAAGQHQTGGSGGGGGSGGHGGGDGCGQCLGNVYTPCDHGKPGTPITCTTAACAPDLGCVECVPGTPVCSGNEVHDCGSDGKIGAQPAQVCDAANNQVCAGGKCSAACDVAADQPSNVGCEFWA